MESVFSDLYEVTLYLTTGVVYFVNMLKNVLLLVDKIKKFNQDDKIFNFFFLKVDYISTLKISFFSRVDFL
jgi:hypothetical protein